MDLLERIKEYRDSPALNYSLLKNVLDNNTKPFKPTIFTVLGSLLDVLLTSPELFESLYIVKDIDRPTGDLTNIIENVFNSLDEYNIVDKSMESNINLLITKSREAGYGGKTYKDSKIKENILKLEDYWNILKFKEESGLEYISKAEYEKEVLTVEKLKKEKHTKNIFLKNPIFQEALFGTVNIQGVDVKIKGLPDIIIEEPNRIVLLDVKRTSYGFVGFRKHAAQMYYHMQMSMYATLLEQKYNKPVDCAWLVVHNSNSRIFPVSEKDLHIGRYGAKRVNNYVYTDKFQILNEDVMYGFEDAIIKYKSCLELGLNHWDLTGYKNKGIEPKKSIFE